MYLKLLLHSCYKINVNCSNQNEHHYHHNKHHQLFQVMIQSWWRIDFDQYLLIEFVVHHNS